MNKRDKAILKLVSDASRLAANVYLGTEYRPGMPYYEHCARVAHAVIPFGYIYEATAYLHDIIEDKKGEITLGDIDQYFGRDVGKAVAAISRLPGETYSNYIVRVKKDTVARRVNIADLEENLLWGMAEVLPSPAFTLRRRYLGALAELLE